MTGPYHSGMHAPALFTPDAIDALADTLRPSLKNLDEFSKTDLLAAGSDLGDAVQPLAAAYFDTPGQHLARAHRGELVDVPDDEEGGGREAQEERGLFHSVIDLV